MGTDRQEDGSGETLTCSFCKKTQDQIRKLISGPTSNICDECVEVCTDILSDDRMQASAAGETNEPSAPSSPLLAARCSLCRMPVVAQELVAVVGRGAVCPPCIAAVQALPKQEA